MGSKGMGLSAATEAVLTMAPPPRLRRACTAARVPIITPATFTPITRSIFSMLASGQPGASPVMMPALLCTMSMPPKAASTEAKSAATPAGVDTSASKKEARPSAPAMARTVSSPPARSMSATATVAPSAANATAVARPMPDDAPVTSATFP